MKLKLWFTVFLWFVLLNLSSARTYFIAVNGNDANSGTKEAPFATINKAQSVVFAGDTVFIRGGTYKVQEDQIMNYSTDGVWARTFHMNKSGIADNRRIYYWGYENERPVFDMSLVKPQNRRVIAFYVSGSFLHFKNFEVVGTQVTIVGHTQSECFRNDGGNDNIYEHITMRDGMAIGFYLVRGFNNLVLNCDAYNNYDYLSDGGRGGNVDGFGGHPNNTGSVGNVFKGCRAWYNSDDGFDLISAFAAYTMEDCWAFYNGYRPGGFVSAGDGAGFKSGGYGMGETASAPSEIPMHIVKNCIAYYNKNQGFYANHHLGGIHWENNTGYMNPSNFNMLTRKSREEAVDVDGYGHIIKNNLSFNPRTSGRHIINVNTALSSISNNSFLPNQIEVTANDFVSLNQALLLSPRQADGSLPNIDFLKLKTTSALYAAGMGYYFTEREKVVVYDWLIEAAIVVEKDIARIVGPESDQYMNFFVNGQKVLFTNRTADLAAYTGELVLTASTREGNVIRKKIVKP